jgi:hypothetical protein
MILKFKIYESILNNISNKLYTEVNYDEYNDIESIKFNKNELDEIHNICGQYDIISESVEIKTGEYLFKKYHSLSDCDFIKTKKQTQISQSEYSIVITFGLSTYNH